MRLDLDAIQPEKATITLGGKDYTMEPPRVVDIIELQKMALAIEKDGDIQSLEKVIEKLIPGIEAKTLDIAKLRVLMNFILEYFTGEEGSTEQKKGASK